MKNTKSESIDANALLYDQNVLERANEQYGPPAEIKHNVETSAKVYEIRTAMRFWFDDEEDHRTSDRIWNNCEAFALGHRELNNFNEVVPA